MAGSEGEIKAKGPGRAQQGQGGGQGTANRSTPAARGGSCATGPATVSGYSCYDCWTDVSGAHPRRREGEGRGAPPRQGPASLPGTGWSRTSRLEETKQSHGQGWPGSPPALGSRGFTRQPGGAQRATRGQDVRGIPEADRHTVRLRHLWGPEPSVCGGNQPPSTNPAPGCPPERSRASTRGSERPTSGCNGALDRRW